MDVLEIGTTKKIGAPTPTSLNSMDSEVKASLTG